MKNPTLPTLDELKVRGDAAMTETRLVIDDIVRVVQHNRRVAMYERLRGNGRKSDWVAGRAK